MIPSPKTVDQIYAEERQTLVEVSKSEYATFRATRLSINFDYLRELQCYRENKYTKYTPQ